MSWFVTTQEPVTKESFESAGAGLLNAPNAPQNPKETSEQFKLAVEAASVLIWGVGRPEDKVGISLSGHANAGHAPQDGWSPETVTITIQVATPR